MRNLIKYCYNKAKNCGVNISPTKELMNLGFEGIRINDMYLPEYIIYETRNVIDKLPDYIELCPLKTDSPDTTDPSKESFEKRARIPF